MANETSKDPAIPQPQLIPLAKIHDLPGARTSKQPDKSYGGLVTSIQASGVKEPVVLRVREDGEYQLVTPVNWQRSRTSPPWSMRCPCRRRWTTTERYRPSPA